MNSTVRDHPAPFEEGILHELLAVQAELNVERARADQPASRHRLRWGRVSVPSAGAAVVALTLVGGGIAAAIGLASPTPQQAHTIYNNYYPDHGAQHLAGSRPTLNAEMVICDYNGLPSSSGDSGFTQSMASSEPLTVSVTPSMLIDACAHSVPPSIPAHLCETTQASHYAVADWPEVVYGNTSCATAAPIEPGVGTVPAGASLVKEVNQRRDIEASILAIPESCPTKAQGLSWVQHQLQQLQVKMSITEIGSEPGGSCYLPIVEWHGLPDGPGPWVVVSTNHVP